MHDIKINIYPKRSKLNKDLNDMGYFDFLVRMNVGINERVQ